MDRLRSNANDMESEIQSTDEKKTKGFVHRCSSKLVFLKISKLYRKTSALESLFNKVPRSQTPTLVLCFPLNIATFLRTSFYRTHLVAASGISPVLKRKQASGL